MHFTTTVAAADYFSLVLASGSLMTHPWTGWRFVGVAGTVTWATVTGLFVQFLRGISDSRRRDLHGAGPVDAVIVLGAGLVRRRPGAILARRIDRAVELVPPSVPLVMSGGKGDDEEVTEAHAMAAYAREKYGPQLRARGVDVVEEVNATNTRENLRFSVQNLRAQGHEARTVAVVTSDFHVKRTKMTTNMVEQLLIDEEPGLNFVVCGAQTPKSTRPSAYLREFVAYALWSLRG